MRIPSYDDLTPSIPDVSPAEVFDVARILPGSQDPVARRRAAPVARRPSSALFACLHSTRTPDALVPLAKEFSPRIQRYGACAVVLDVSGLGRLLGDAQAIGTELQRAARERSNGIHVAIAPTQTAALLLAHSPSHRFERSPGLTVITGDVEDAVAEIPLTVLRRIVEEAHGQPPALHEKMFDMLQRWGLTTIGELARLPAAELSQRVGRSGLAIYQLAAGVDPAPLVPDPSVPRFVESMELEWPIEQLEALSFVLARLLDPLSISLERADRGAAAIHVDLRLVDRTTHARVLQLPAAMRDPRALRTLVLLDLESHPPAAAIDVVTIELDPAPARIIQYSLLARARPSAETLATLTARLNALVGESRCGSPVLLDTHRPDAFAMRRFAPEEPALGARPPTELGTRGSGLGTRGSGLGARGAGLDGLAHPVLRRFRPPVAIRVAVESGRPVHVAIDRRRMPGGRVERAAGPWRTSGAWWDVASTRWDRDEWDVALSDGSLCRLYRDRLSGSWFLDGVLD